MDLVESGNYRHDSDDMCYRKLILATMGLGCLAAAPSLASAQLPRASRYQPRRPTVSPYLDLFRTNNNSNLPNYFTFVRPKQQVQAFEREQAAANVAIVRNLRNQAELIQESEARDAGRVGGFMNTLHFFPQSRGQRR